MSKMLLHVGLWACLAVTAGLILAHGAIHRTPLHMDFVLHDDNPVSYVHGFSDLMVSDCGLSLTRFGVGMETVVVFRSEEQQEIVFDSAFISFEKDLTVAVFFNGNEVARYKGLPAQEIGDEPVFRTLRLRCLKGGNTLLVVYQPNYALGAPLRDSKVAYSVFTIASR